MNPVKRYQAKQEIEIKRTNKLAQLELRNRRVNLLRCLTEELREYADKQFEDLIVQVNKLSRQCPCKVLNRNPYSDRLSILETLNEASRMSDEIENSLQIVGQKLKSMHEHCKSRQEIENANLRKIRRNMRNTSSNIGDTKRISEEDCLEEVISSLSNSLYKLHVSRSYSQGCLQE